MLHCIFKRKNFLAGSLLLCSSILVSQVTIKEAISITPTTPTLVQLNSPVSHTLRFEGVSDVPIFLRMFTGHCFGRTDTGTGSIVFEMPLMAGGYTFDFQPRVAELRSNQVCNVTLTLKLDGQVVMQAGASFTGGSLAIFALWPGVYPSYSSPYNTTFAFSIGDSILYEEGWIPSIQGVNTCDDGTWDPASSVNLQITSGSNYAQFYDYNTRLAMGTSVSGTVQQIQDNYEVVADGAMPDSSGAFVSVLATSGGITQTASLKIKPYFFQVSVDSLRIDYGSSTAIRVRSVDAAGRQYYRSVMPSVRIRIVDSLAYGTLWYGSDDSSSVRQIGDTLTNVTSVVNAGLYSGLETRFYANEQQPKDSVRVQIAVEKTGEGGMVDYYPPSVIPFPGRDIVKGSTQVTVLVPVPIPVTKQLKIVDHSPWEIWPNLKASSKGIRGYQPKRGFTIQVTDGSGAGVVDDSVTVRTEFEPLSGGHNHGNSPLPLSLQGKFYCGRKNGNPITLTTNDSGKIIIDSLIASEVAGKFLVRAFLTSDSTVSDTINLRAKVPNLILFHGNGKYDTTGRTDSHPVNHYFCSQAAIDSLIAAASSYARQDWNTDENMKLNDMSLVWGGLFDLDHAWTASKGHDLHRIGKSVDIENLQVEQIDTVSIYTGKDTVFNVPKVKWVKNFQDFMENRMKTWKFIDEHQVEPDVFKRTRKYPHFEWKGN